MNYNFEKGIEADLSSGEFLFAYRGQPYDDDPKTIRSPIFLNHSPKNRFSPTSSDVLTMYYGYKPETAIIESFGIFREAAVPAQLKFGKTELSKIELVKFKLTSNLKLLDLCDDLALANLRIKTDSPILTSTDTAESRNFADKVLANGYDGIMYRTRQGVSYAVVVFSVAEHKLQDHEIVERMNLWDAFHRYNIHERIGGIRLIDDTTSIEDSLESDET